MIGIDIVDTSRIRLTDSFIHYILTEEEYAVFAQIRTEQRKIEYFGGRFAAKEAIFKATQDQNYLAYTVLNHENGMPYVKDHPEIQISISHDGGMAAAVALILG